MSLKESLIIALEQAYQQQREFVDSLPEAERPTTGTPDHWDAKDIVTHNTVWQQRLVNELDSVARGEPMPVYGLDDDENAGIFAAHHDLDWEAVRRLMDETHTRLMTYVRGSEEAVLSDPARSPWGDNRTAWTRIAGNCIVHTLKHLATYDIEHGRPQRALQLAEDLPHLMLQDYNDAKGRGITLYNQGCLYALAGQPDRAVSKLGEALTLNPGLVEWSQQDPDLASLRGRDDYQALYSG